MINYMINMNDYYYKKHLNKCKILFGVQGSLKFIYSLSILFFRCQQAVLTGNEQDNLALCDQCRFAFCKKCKKTYHSQTLCAHEYELLQLKEQRRKLRQKMQALNLQPQDEDDLLREFL